MNQLRVVVVALLFLSGAVRVNAVLPTSAELSLATEWARANFAQPTNVPFKFSYAGTSSTALLKKWTPLSNSHDLDQHRTERTLTWNDEGTGLQVRCVVVEYHDFPTIEWTLYFKNLGTNPTPILSDIQPLNTTLALAGNAEIILHHQTGSPYSPNDYQPLTSPLAQGQKLRFAPPAGRPTDSVLPCFNLERGNAGVIVVVGWPGQWAAQFSRETANDVQIVAGQEITNFKLHPGEEVRTPLMVLQFWQGDWIRAQNIWRRWMLTHNVPRPGGKLPQPQFIGCSSHQFAEMINANEANQKQFINGYLKQGLKLDYWWMDAGWYFHEGKGWPQTGTWEVDTNRFPRGLRAITDHAHSNGVKSIVWFEPERVAPGSWLYVHHPEWLLGRDGEQKLLNLGNTEARKWLTQHIDSLLRSQGIDLYRQDFNIDPLNYWRTNDAEDRKGVTENHYVTGYLAYWDELRRRHPDMLIDSCASGGRRNDLETLRRAVPLLRSDFILEPGSQQNHSYGIPLWIPYYGTGVNSFDPYVFRSQMCPSCTACYDLRNENQDFASLRKLYRQWRQINPNYAGDYYPLTSYPADDTVWIAWQFDRPEQGEGVVQVFRRLKSVYESARFKLRGLEADAPYVVTDVDSGETTAATGRELSENGLLVKIAGSPVAVIQTYRKAR